MTDVRQDQGLDPNKLYPAVVVANVNPALPNLCLIRARVPGIMDETPDDALPWAIPMWTHPDGSTADSGMVMIPKVGSKVSVRFQGGSPLHPVYGGYNVDNTTVLDEAKHNYPNRIVYRFQNGMCLIIDTTSDEVIVQMPGDVKWVIGGSLDLTVAKDMNVRVGGAFARSVTGNAVEKCEALSTTVRTTWSTSSESRLDVVASTWQQKAEALSSFATAISSVAKAADSRYASTITDSSSGAITSIAAASNFHVGSTAALVGGGGMLAVSGSAAGGVGMSSNGPLVLESNGHGIDLDPGTGVAKPEIPEVPKAPAAPDAPDVPSVPADNLPGVSRGVLPSVWSDK